MQAALGKGKGRKSGKAEAAAEKEADDVPAVVEVARWPVHGPSNKQDRCRNNIVHHYVGW